ncbi:hypothetical protein NQZ68_012463, partial [Dissostichus eleginoides]
RSLLEEVLNTEEMMVAEEIKEKESANLLHYTADTSRDCRCNARVNIWFCQFSVLQFGIQSNRRISIREHFHPLAYRLTELQLCILFLALLLMPYALK